MHILKTDYQGNPNVGLFGFANDKFCLVGSGFRKKVLKEMHEVLKVPVYQITLCGTDLIGVFCAGNNEAILLPSIVSENELGELKKLGINCKVISTDLTALGNNILCNDQGALVNPEFSARVKKLIRTTLNVPLNPGLISSLEITGSVCIIARDKALISPHAAHHEIEKVEQLLGVKCTKATVNFGSQFLRSGIIANSNGFILGNASTGVEMDDIDHGLGFIG